jgi:potassium efflux system protein
LFALAACLGGAATLAAADPLPGLLPGGAATTPIAEKGGRSVADIEVRRSALQKEIAATRQELAKLPEGVSEDAARWLAEETALLERIDAVLSEQARTWQEAADLAIEAAAVVELTRNQRPPEATLQPPYDLALLDQLYAERDGLESATSTLERDLENAGTMVREADDYLKEKDRERRAVRGNSGTIVTAGNAPGHLRLAELESRLAQETLFLREKALQTLKQRQALIEPKQKLLRPRLAWLTANLTLGPAPSPETMTDLAAALDPAIAAAKEMAQTATRNVIALERRAVTEQVADELQASRANRQAANLTLSALTAQRERFAEKAKITGLRRRVLAGGMPAADLRALAQENQTALDGLVRQRSRGRTALIRSRRELQDWQGRLTQAAATGTVAPWSLERAKRLAEWIQVGETELADLDRLRIGRSRLQEEIGSRVTLFSWRDASARAREGFGAAWNFEIFSVQDQPVRVKTILMVLLLVVLGYYASRWLSEQVSHHVFHRLGMNTGRRAAWQSLWFYGLFVVVLVVAFNLFHISLTQFSVVTGALAVGIGFGSQNLISNFISGIILLIERPVNQGDVIEIDGRRVTVERLGARSTIVRTLDNTHMIVPNSLLLEKPVINWTLSDEVVRQQIKLGVAYGSPTRRVDELLQGVLAAVEGVRPEPKPLVKFADFGESSLNFEVFFWATIEERLETENEIRHRIAEVFATEGIIMAFPQRDVHLETTKPLQVVFTSAPGPAPAQAVAVIPPGSARPPPP